MFSNSSQHYGALTNDGMADEPRYERVGLHIFFFHAESQRNVLSRVAPHHLLN